MNLPFHPHGAVPPGRALYVPRPADRILVDELSAGRHCHVMGSRQSGKTSLLYHAYGPLREKGLRVALVNLSATNIGAGVTSSQWAESVVRAAARTLEYDDLDGRLHAEFANRSMSFTEGLRLVLAQEASPLVLMLDELDSVEDYDDFKNQILGALRGVQQTTLDRVLSRLVLCLAGVRTPARIAADGAGRGEAAEPLGSMLWLDDFPLDDETVSVFAEGFGEPTATNVELARAILAFGGGYPQACTWLARLVQSLGLSTSPDFLPERLGERISALLGRGIGPTTPREVLLDTGFFNIVEGYLRHGQDAPSALSAYDRLLASRTVRFDDRDPAHRLLLYSGLCRADGDGRLRIRCPLFRVYFDASWSAVTGEAVRRGATPTPLVARRRSSKRICVLLAGGTIGMKETPGGKVEAPPTLRDLTQLDALDRLAEVERYSLFPYDSADVGPEQWVDIAREIKRLEDRFDGFVVTHGTDTMAYTASAVSFALGPNLSTPVVFTGAQTTIDVEHGDATTNLLRAGLVALEDIPEVVVCFGETVFRGCRVQKKDDRRFDAFESPGHPPLAYVAEEVLLLRQNIRQHPGGRIPIDLRASFASGILHVVQTPGSYASFYRSALREIEPTGERRCRGVVVQSLGAGNIPTRDSRYALKEFIGEANALGIPVVITSQYPVHPANLTRYSPALAALEAGAIPTGNMTIAAVIAKFSWVLAQVDEQIRRGEVAADQRIDKVRQTMGTEYVGEGGGAVIDPRDTGRLGLR